MNCANKITLFGVGTVGAIGSVLLLSKYLTGSNKNKNGNKKRKKLSKREIMLLKRNDIKDVTDNIYFTPKHHGDNASQHNILYSDQLFGKILVYLTSFDYLNTVCRLSKYHYLYLNQRNINFDLINKHILFSMLLNESNKSWNLYQIEKCFNSKTFVDIYDFLFLISNNWRYVKKGNDNNQYRQIIAEMIYIPSVIPNINIVKYWFNYISNKTQIPIRHLSFKTSSIEKDNNHYKDFFLSSLENPYELNLFLWIIIYNLKQLNLELNMNWKNNDNKNIIHSNYFGFEQKLQEWLVFEHKYIVTPKSDICSLLKLYNMIMSHKEEEEKSKYHDLDIDIFNKNMIYILCMYIKIIFHNTELHIVRINKMRISSLNNNDNENIEIEKEWIKLEEIFITNLYSVICFIQYVVQINNNNVKLLKLFKSLLKKSNIKMVNNILKWFSKVNNKNIFHTPSHNILSLSVLPIYFQLLGVKSKICHENTNNIAIWL